MVVFVMTSAFTVAMVLAFSSCAFGFMEQAHVNAG
jgi:hypothetical protein